MAAQVAFSVHPAKYELHIFQTPSPRHSQHAGGTGKSGQYWLQHHLTHNFSLQNCAINIITLLYGIGSTAASCDPAAAVIGLRKSLYKLISPIYHPHDDILMIQTAVREPVLPQELRVQDLDYLMPLLHDVWVLAIQDMIGCQIMVLLWAPI